MVQVQTQTEVAVKQRRNPMSADMSAPYAVQSPERQKTFSFHISPAVQRWNYRKKQDNIAVVQKVHTAVASGR